LNRLKVKGADHVQRELEKLIFQQFPILKQSGTEDEAIKTKIASAKSELKVNLEYVFRVWVQDLVKKENLDTVHRLVVFT
jgi:hypothetical protein